MDFSHFAILLECFATLPSCGAMGITDLFIGGNGSKHCTTMTIPIDPSPL